MFCFVYLKKFSLSLSHIHTHIPICFCHITALSCGWAVTNTLRMKIILWIHFFMAQKALVGQGCLIIEASWSHSVSHTTLVRTPLDEWSAQCWDLYLPTQYSQETGKYATSKFWTHSSSNWAVHKLTYVGPCSHWNWLCGCSRFL
jgi:hypothetical protein